MEVDIKVLLINCWCVVFFQLKMKEHHKAFTAKLSERVKAHREKNNLSHNTLAEKCSCSTKTIARIENGTTNPGILILLDMAIAFGIPLEDLVRE